MRLLLLMLNIVISMSFLTNTSDALAASVTRKSKQQHAVIREKAPNSGDVWERIRLGMKIFWVTPAPKPSKGILIPANNNLTDAYSLHSEPQTSASATMNIRDAAHTEDAQPGQPTANYITRPHTAIAPLHHYTALGFRLRFGTDKPSIAHDNCIPAVSTQTRQEQALKSKNNSSESISRNNPYPQAHKNAVLISPVNGTVRAKSEMSEPLATATNNPTPCLKHTDQHLVATNKQEKQRETVGQKNTKKQMISERINKHIASLSHNPGYLYRVTERARPYLYHIVEALSKKQLPLELALLPIVESAYQPTALSPKGAAGLWQFMPGTGRDYGLKQNNQYDERLDILASTQAAIRFLSDLKDHFKGDWLLALAAYNCGPGVVDDAISRNLLDGLEIDYWSLRLPEETQDYVPRLLALSNIFANPEIYGLKFAAIKNETYFVKVKIDHDTGMKYLINKNFALLAKLANLSHEHFSRLNPGYLNPTLSTGSYTFLLPLANANQFHQLLTSITQFMAEPTSKMMNNTLKENSPFIMDLNESRLASIGL